MRQYERHCGQQPYQGVSRKKKRNQIQPDPLYNNKFIIPSKNLDFNSILKMILLFRRRISVVQVEMNTLIIIN